jgi:hypothetical protein
MWLSPIGVEPARRGPTARRKRRTALRLSRMQTFITETRMCIHALDETYAKSEVRASSPTDVIATGERTA